MPDDAQDGPGHRSDAYTGNRYQRLTLTGDPSKIGHRVLNRLLVAGEAAQHQMKVVEIGSSRGEHLAHVRHRWDEYVMLDIDINNHSNYRLAA